MKFLRNTWIISTLFLCSCRITQPIQTPPPPAQTEAPAPLPAPTTSSTAPFVIYNAPPQKEEKTWTEETLRLLIAEISTLVSLFIVGQNNNTQ